MINPNNLLEQFLGANAANSVRQAGGATKQQLDNMGMGGFAGGAVAGSLLGLVLGNKKMRKMAGGAVGYGGAAAGALAFKAYQNWQQGKAAATAPLAAQADFQHVDQKFLPDFAPATNGQPFQLIMIRAMISAAKADGHIDAQEQKTIFEHVEKMGLDAESKAFVFDALTQPVDINAIASAARGIEQATELYLVSRMAIDPDHPAERAYLQALGHKLNLQPELIAHLEHQVAATNI